MPRMGVEAMVHARSRPVRDERVAASDEATAAVHTMDEAEAADEDDAEARRAVTAQRSMACVACGDGETGREGSRRVEQAQRSTRAADTERKQASRRRQRERGGRARTVLRRVSTRVGDYFFMRRSINWPLISLAYA